MKKNRNLRAFLRSIEEQPQPPIRIIKALLLGFDVNDNDGWRPAQRDTRHDGHDWEFQHINTVEFPDGNIAHCGRYYNMDYPKFVSTFIYLPTKKLLCITSLDTSPCSRHAHQQKIYVVERANANNYWLYPPGDSIRLLVKHTM